MIEQTMEFHRATRQGVKPLIGLYSESGCGKTYSALLLARGLAGPNGRIGMVDTESGRGSLYADVIPGSYETLELRQPFSPERYRKAIDALEAGKFDIGIIDSASHEWEGVGGVLDLAGENEAKSGKPGLHNWRLPKLEHAKFMLRLLQSPLPLIVCIRAKHKSRQTKENGKTVIIKEDFTTPIQAEDFIFELTAHAEILADHSIKLTKCSHPSLKSCFPEKGPITIEHGRLVGEWCKAPGQSPKDETRELAKELWSILEPIRGTERNWSKCNQFLLDECIITDTEYNNFNAPLLSPQRFKEAIEKAKEKIGKLEVTP